MPSKKHRIDRTKARELTKAFKAKRGAANGLFRKIPDGFMFDAAEVRNLLSAANAAHFVIGFGWKPGAQENLTPVLFTLDKDYRIIEATPKDSPHDGVLMPLDEGDTGAENGGGGFLDEADPVPPPNIDI